MSVAITAIYEKGVLRPLQEIPFREHQRIKIVLEPNISWRREFKNLLNKVHSRAAKFSPKVIEKDITLASQQIRKLKNGCKSRY